MLQEYAQIYIWMNFRTAFPRDVLSSLSPRNQDGAKLLIIAQLFTTLGKLQIITHNMNAIGLFPYTGEQKVYFYLFKRPEHYNQEVLSHSFICLPLPYMEGIVSICNIDLHCVITIFNGTGDMFNRSHFYTLSSN